ncbi:MAG: hypothetical protein J7K48_09270 [Thermococcus sp.]|nr:hypothetical protein [Thermococcus sp.]
MRKDSLAPIFAFLIGLGLGQFLQWVAGELGQLSWLDALLGMTKIGIIGYTAWLGLKQIAKTYLEWKRIEGASATAIERKFNALADAYAAFIYLLVAFLFALMMF